MELSKSDFDFISTLVKTRSGIFLTTEKGYLIDSRLTPIVKRLELNSSSELIAKLKMSNDEALMKEIVENMTTNESSFFRDIKPFEQLKSIIIPYIKNACPTKKNFRIWSAACSTGQEPYSIAMTVKEDPSLANFKFEIYASDLSLKTLEKAKLGSYSQFEVQRGLPISMLIKYFDQIDGNWVIKDEIKSMIQFNQVNLIENLADLGKFDIILCRNVLIYFEIATKVQILNNLSKLMNSSSVLMLGCTETIVGIENRFTPMPGSSSFFTLSNN